MATTSDETATSGHGKHPQVQDFIVVGMSIVKGNPERGNSTPLEKPLCSRD